MALRLPDSFKTGVDWISRPWFAMMPPFRATAENVLSAHHPRFWWHAKFAIDGKDLLDLLFDATGIARSFPLQMAIWRDESFALAGPRAKCQGVRMRRAPTGTSREQLLKPELACFTDRLRSQTSAGGDDRRATNGISDFAEKLIGGL
jgi:hypothetical protein